MSETPTLNGDEKTVVENVLPVADEQKEAGSSKCTREIKVKKKFQEEDDVLSRWSDGLLYLGIVIKVDEESEKCLVKFEDNSEHWAMFKDLQKGAVHDSDIVCSLCESGESEAPNEIVICDNCGFGFHQLCHNPEIPVEVLQPDIPWLCRQCAIIKSSKNGNIIKKSPVGMTMKNVRSFPYDMVSLSWDTFHKTNMQQCYCYCGGPGEWYMKMLQCFRCKQWFHEACIQSLDKPMLFGDRFYIFVCSVCNSGTEYIHRLDMKWPDVAHLVIYNLTVKHNKKYFDFETGIMPFVERNWKLLQLGGCLGSTTSDDRRINVLTALQNNKSRFKCGKEIKKKTTIWGLRVKMPPPPPKINLPMHGVITNDVFKHCQSSKRSKCVNIPVPATTTAVGEVVQKKPGKRGRKSKKELRMLAEAAAAKANLSKDTKVTQVHGVRELTRRKNGIAETAVNLCKTTGKRKYTKRAKQDVINVCVNNTDNSKKKTTKKYVTTKKGKNARAFVQELNTKNKANRMSCKQDCKNYLTTPVSVRCRVPNRFENNSSDDDEDTSSHGTLDSIIPPPTNFEGHNHPFRNLDLFPVSLSSLARPLKRKLKHDDIRVTKNGQIKQRRLKRRRNPYVVNGYSNRLNGQMSELSVDTGSELEGGSNENLTMEAIQAAKISFHDLKSSVHSYFGAANRIASGERFNVLARRITLQGKAQYLIEWEGLSA